jgi:hypothetical protein
MAMNPKYPNMTIFDDFRMIFGKHFSNDTLKLLLFVSTSTKERRRRNRPSVRREFRKAPFKRYLCAWRTDWRIMPLCESYRSSKNVLRTLVLCHSS